MRISDWSSDVCASDLGRSVIGIELPNVKREMVNLHELVASQNFEDLTAQLPIILGKNIAGDPVIADLAPMPHLLVAGTTGSGKSVGLDRKSTRLNSSH